MVKILEVLQGKGSVSIANQKKKRRKNKKKKKSNQSADIPMTQQLVGVAAATKKGRRRSARARGARQSLHPTTQAYLQTLNDPFKHGGVRIGFGCMIPTQTTMCYVKGSFTVSTIDGSFRLNAFPWCTSATNNGAILSISNNGAASTPTYATILSSNVTNVNSSFNFGRVISGGVRAFVRYPQTSQGGIINSYSLPLNSTVGTTQAINTNLSLNQAVTTSQDEVTILYRPTDYNDMEFSLLNNAASNVSLGSWQGYIDGVGYPTGAMVYYEVVFHVEAYTTTSTASVTDLAQETNWPTLADVHANVESAMSTIRSYLTPEVIEGASNLFNEWNSGPSNRKTGGFFA